MAGQTRRCGNCGEPLRVTARTDARYCGRACKAAARRRRQHFWECVAIGRAFLRGEQCELVATCPVCRRRFALGHGHRRDAIYDRPACRQAAYRARRAERARQAVTPHAAVTAPETPSKALTCHNANGAATDDQEVEERPSLSPTDPGKSPVTATGWLPQVSVDAALTIARGLLGMVGGWGRSLPRRFRCSAP